MITETHFAAPEEIMALLDGELSPQRTQAVSAHLDECAECREFAEMFRSSSESLATWNAPAVPPNTEIAKRLAEAAGQLPAQVSAAGFSRWCELLRRRWMIAAGAAAFVLVIALALSRRATAPTAVDMARTNRGGAAGGLSDLPLRARSFQPKPSVNDKRMATSQLSENLVQSVDGQVSSLEPSGVVPPDDRFSPTEGLQTPMIARAVTLSIMMKDFGFSRTALDAILARHHGYAASLNVSTQQNAARSLQASLRIPAGELSAAVAELRSLGQVENEAQSGEEVTQQHADLVARLKNSRETEQRLQAMLLQRTGKISDVLAVEQEIARVRGEIEQMEAEQKSLEHRVDFASVDLNIAEEYKAQLGSPSPPISTRFHNALVAGYRSAVEEVVGIVLFLAEFGPSTLICLAFLVPLAWFLHRRWVRATSLPS
jgi:Domain of unknown function (DUF4349)/Putative zinc-finger